LGVFKVKGSVIFDAYVAQSMPRIFYVRRLFGLRKRSLKVLYVHGLIPFFLGQRINSQQGLAKQPEKRYVTYFFHGLNYLMGYQHTA
jgi:hypothetical protein